MVYRKTRRRAPVSYLGLFLILLELIVVAALLFLGIVLHSISLNNTNLTSSDISAVRDDDSQHSNRGIVNQPIYTKVDFQSVVDEWVSQTGGNKSVLVYDLERDEVVGNYRSEDNYSTASLYKLFVVYVGYTKIQSGEWNADDLTSTTGKTIIECLDLSIRESNSECAEAIWDKIGRDDLDEIIKDKYSIDNTIPSQLSSNPQDIAKMLKVYYWHKQIADNDLISRMKDSFLNQPATNYDWRQGLPSGFSDDVNVYNKVGWDYNPDGGYWNLYHDAAIVEFPDGRHFIVVVMTNHVSFQQIKKFGTMLERYYNS